MRALSVLALMSVALLGCPNDSTRKSSKNSESDRRRQKVYDAMSQVQNDAERALDKVEDTYKKAVKAANEIKEQVVREAGDAHEAAQALIADAKRAADVRDSVPRNTDEAVSMVEQALGITTPKPQTKEDDKEKAAGIP